MITVITNLYPHLQALTLTLASPTNTLLLLAVVHQLYLRYPPGRPSHSPRAGPDPSRHGTPCTAPHKEPSTAPAQIRNGGSDSNEKKNQMLRNILDIDPDNLVLVFFMFIVVHYFCPCPSGTVNSRPRYGKKGLSSSRFSARSFLHGPRRWRGLVFVIIYDAQSMKGEKGEEMIGWLR